MYKTLLLLLCCLSAYGQKLHHQALTSQGANVPLANKTIVSQSIGQSSSIGNFRTQKVVVGQGYIQSVGIVNFSTPLPNTFSAAVYPNPVIDIATFKFSSNLESTLTINFFDARGRLVYKHKAQLNQNYLSISLSALSAGIYFVKFETPNTTFSTKILKS
jgi:hypothetical protein